MIGGGSEVGMNRWAIGRQALLRMTGLCWGGVSGGRDLRGLCLAPVV
jgi:hypothetical protein